MSAPRATRASGQREKLGNLLLEDVPDKCMDVDARVIGHYVLLEG